MIGKTGGELVSIPMPQIDIPEFRYGSKNSGGVGQGPGDVGTPIGRAADGDEPGGAGDSPGHHILEVELTLDELAQILGEGLALPRIEPKGRANIIEEKDKYTGIRQAGPESLRHFKRTYKKALKRQIASNSYNPDDPLVIPVREDKLYRSWNPIPLPHSNAVVLYLMDVSGSMTDYSRALLQFAYAAGRSGGRVEVFVFGTRLARITRQLRHRRPDVALEQAAKTVTDRDGGTRIGASLDFFVRRWGRAGMCRGAVVVICSDGLDRGAPELLSSAMSRLERLCYRIVWLNPHVGPDVLAFRPSTVGMMVAAPYVDRLLSGHDLASLEELAATLPSLK